MLKENRSKVVLSSIAAALPILFGVLMWNSLPDMMPTHWGLDGTADRFSGKAFAVFGLPSILLLLHFVCLFFTLGDSKQRDQSPKALGMIFWIVPCISLFTSGITYCAAYGRTFDLLWLLPLLLGAMLIFMGNYLPKIKQNRTLGIKVPWALNNEENWNKTHRLGGKVWVAGGLAMLFSSFLPQKAMVGTMVCVMAAVMLVPVVYSYCIYRQHQREGIAYAAPPASKAEKTAIRISAVIIPIILIGAAVLMFSGKLAVHCDDASFTIHATYWSDLEVDYAQVDAISYREGLDVGMRTYGFRSAKLMLGNFQNDEFGSYTLYAYTGAKAFAVLTSGEKTLVLGMGDASDTQAVYNTILERMGK